MRDISIDILRILACMMIVAMHSPLPAEEGNGLFLSTLSYFTAPGVGLFFMISGALLLPIKTDTLSFFKHRFLKVAVPTVLWSIFYMCCNILLRDELFSWRAVCSIPFSAQANPVFWFIYTLLGLYLISPILSRWLESASRREIEFFLLLWAVTLCYPLIRLFANINDSQTGILYYMAGYVGYYILGYYLRTYPDRIRYRWVVLAMINVWVVPVVLRLTATEVDFYDMFWYLSVFVAVQCVFWWKTIFRLCSTKTPGIQVRRAAEYLSCQTFGIYMVHIFIMRYLLWNWDFILGIRSYVLQTLVIFVLTFVGSWLVSVLLHLCSDKMFMKVSLNEKNIS